MGILGAIAVIAGGIISTLLTNRSNRDLSHEQMNWSEYMQDKQNAYNDPAQQMERLQNAGINPVSMTMNQGQMQLGNTSAQANPYQLLPMSDPLSVLSNSLSSLGSGFDSFQSGKDLLTTREARVKQIDLQNEQTKENIRLLGLNADAQYISNQYANARELWALAGQKANVDLSYRQIKIFDKQYEQMCYTLENIWPAEVQKLIAEKDVAVADLDRVVALTRNFDADTALKGAQKEGVEASTGLTGIQAANEELRGEQIQADTALSDQRVIESRSLLEKYLSKYDAEIENIAAATGKTKEETYWLVFDKLNSTIDRANSPVIGFGSGNARQRIRTAANKRIKEISNP